MTHQSFSVNSSFCPTFFSLIIFLWISFSPGWFDFYIYSRISKSFSIELALFSYLQCMESTALYVAAVTDKILLVMTLFIPPILPIENTARCRKRGIWESFQLIFVLRSSAKMVGFFHNCMKALKSLLCLIVQLFCLVMTKDELVVRMCTIENMDNQCGTFRFDNETLSGCIMTCTKDGCNKAQSITLSILSMLFVIFKLIITFFDKVHSQHLFIGIPLSR